MMCTRTHTDNAHRHTQTHVHIYYICTCMHARRRPPIVVVVVDSFTISKLSSSSLRDKRPNRPITTRRRVPNQTRRPLRVATTNLCERSKGGSIDQSRPRGCPETPPWIGVARIPTADDDGRRRARGTAPRYIYIYSIYLRPVVVAQPSTAVVARPSRGDATEELCVVD